MVEAWNIGAGSLFIVLLISAFAGAVTALQTGYQFTGSIPYYVVGTLVVSGVEPPKRFEWTPLYFKELRVIGSNGFGVEEVGGVAHA